VNVPGGHARTPGRDRLALALDVDDLAAAVPEAFAELVKAAGF